MYGTWHILKQVEWYNKLREKYKCSFVEMEYRERISYGPFRFRSFVIYDVYGRTNDGKIYIIEIGKVPRWKLEYLAGLDGHRGIRFFREEFRSKKSKFINKF
jgi:hypothetical protein